MDAEVTQHLSACFVSFCAGPNLHLPVAKKPRGPIEIKLNAKAERLDVPASVPLRDVLGHAGPKRVLTDAIASGRVHHCWIFQGPQGVGKCTTALAFAALLLDPTTAPDLSGGFLADPDSPVQRMMRAGSHPDVHMIVKELSAFHPDPDVRKLKQKTIPIDVIREFVIAPAAKAGNVSPGGLASKVFIIDEADMLAPAGQNALLKTLEEPPARTVLILITTSDELLLPTIRSRSQRLGFAPLSTTEMRQWRHSSGRSVGPAEEWLGAFSGGAPGAFAAAGEVGIYAWWEQLASLLRAAEKGEHRVELAPAMWALVDGWAAGWVEAHPQASKESANRTAADWMMRLLAWWAVGGIAASPLQAVARIDAIREAERRLDANVNGLFVMEELAGRLSAAGMATL